MHYFAKILDILQQENSLYEALREISKEKQEAIVSNDISKIEEFTKREQGFVNVIVKLEEERTKAVDLFCEEKNIGRIEKLSELNAYLDRFEVLQLSRVKEQILNNIVRLEEVNKLNTHLVNQSLEYIDLNLALFRPESASYDNNAKDKDINKTRPIFDAKA